MAWSSWLPVRLNLLALWIFATNNALYRQSVSVPIGSRIGRFGPSHADSVNGCRTRLSIGRGEGRLGEEPLWAPPDHRFAYAQYLGQ